MKEARLADTRLTAEHLMWVVGCIALILIPHALRMPVWVTALFVVLAAARVGAARMRWPMPPAWLRAVAALIGIIAIGVQFRAWGGQEAGIAMLVVMTALKLTETVSKRDGMVLICVGFILIIGNFLYAQTLPTGTYMLVVTLCMMATLLHLAHPSGGIPLRPRFRTAGALLLQALPIAALLFVLFPRVPGPLWGVPAGQQAVAGLTDRMEPGAIAQLSRSAEVAFRVTFDGPPPPHNRLYWRGPVLREFDGRVWTQGVELDSRGFTYTPLGGEVAYEIALEPTQQRWLFALDLPAEVPDGSAVTRAFQLVARERVRERRLYSLRSYLQYATGPDASPYEVQRGTRLPVLGNPRARDLADDLAARHDTDRRAIVNEMLLRFRTEPFYYTLSPPLLGTHSVDEFLFDTRRGFCEHYAGSFAFVMRAAGVPTRVVLGYMGGELNPIGDYMIVRQSDAHAWVEVFLQDEGWVRVDPTGAVAPDRIEGGIDAIAGLEGRVGGALADIAWLKRLGLRWDDINNRWNLFVLGFDRERQREMIERLGFRGGDYGTLVALLVVSLGLVMAVLTGWLVWRSRPVRARDAAARLYARLQRRLTRMGVAERALAEGPRDYARRARDAVPAAAGAIDEFMEAYLRNRYGRGRSPADLAVMKAALRNLRR